MANTTIKSGSINLLNTIIGAGILAMPFGLKSNGLVFGSCLIIWSALTSSFGLYLQTKVSKYTDQQQSVSFFSLSQLTYPSLLVLFDLAISIKCFGVGISYLVIIGDLMPRIMDALNVEHSLLLHRNFWISVFMLFIAPISYLRKLDSLKYTSVIALFSVIYLIVLVVYHSIIGNDSRPEYHHPHIDYYGPLSIQKLLKSFPILVFAYTCHQNMFAIINELQPGDAGSKTRQSNIIIRNSILTACACYLIVGISGYLTFGDKVNGNIITMYSKDSLSSLIGRLCIVIMVALSFPLQCHPCRGSLNHVIYFIKEFIHKRKDTAMPESDNLINNDQSADSSFDESFISTTPMEGSHDTAGHDPIIVPLNSRDFYLITSGIVLFSYLIAISVKSLEHVLALVGSTGSTSILFILPGLFGYLLIRPKDGKATILETFCKYGGLALSIWGVLVMIVCLSATIFFGATH